MDGYLSLVLHAHLPFVRHPEYPDFLEEDWLYEAITETYVPLLRMMTRLERDGVPFRLTMSLTPPLCEMLADPLLQERYVHHLERLLELARAQRLERRGTPFQAAASAQAEELESVHAHYVERWGRQLLPVFKGLQDRGSLQIVTCGATHGFLPLMATDEARNAQIEIAARSYARHFGRRPEGIWLAECAYAPGVDRFLADAGIRFFFMETHGLVDSRPPARFRNYRPVYAPSGVAAFGRDVETSHQVWSADTGYPGDPWYREFYRDLGYDLPYDQVRPYLHGDGVRRNVGLKFHRVTGKVELHQKQPYEPARAAERAWAHAADFLENRQRQARYLKDLTGVVPHVTAPYDAELFGHWWYEGPLFIEALLRQAAQQSSIQMVTPGEYLALEPVHQMVSPALSSWGAEGYFKVWLNGTNDWIYPHLHVGEERMVALANAHPDAEGLTLRALNQAARELLLAQSSDWAFIMTMDTTVPYAQKRTRDHLHRLFDLADQIEAGSIDAEALSEIESRDNPFPELDYRLYRTDALKTQGAGSAVLTLR